MLALFILMSYQHRIKKGGVHNSQSRPELHREMLHAASNVSQSRTACHILPEDIRKLSHLLTDAYGGEPVGEKPGDMSSHSEGICVVSG